jgi:hypothetical protein
MAELLVNPPVFVREDWDDDDAFDGPYDDLSADVLPGITVERGRDQGRVIGGPKVPTSAWVLTNESRLYTTAYSGSPLHAVLAPGHAVEVGRKLGDDTVTMGDVDVEMGDPDALIGGFADALLFTGYSEEPTESLRIGDRVVRVSAYGRAQRLIETPVSIGYQAIITTGAAMVRAWEAAGLVDGTDFVVDPDEIANGYELLHWFVDGRSAWDVTRQVWANAGPPSAVYEAPDGRMHFEGKNYRSLTPRSMTVQQTFSDNTFDMFFIDMGYAPSHASVINDMSLEVEHRAVGALASVWQSQGGMTLANNEVRDVIARSGSDPWTGVVAPVSPTDFTISAGSLVSVTVTALGPLAVQITFTAGASGATLVPAGANTGIQLRAQPVTVVSEEVAVGTVSVVDSQAKFGRRAPATELASAIWRGIATTDAAGLIDGYLLAYREPRAVATVTLQNASGQLLYEMMQLEISDRVHISDSWSGINLDMTIEEISHSIDSLTNHRCRLVCERVVELDWARWDDGQYDVGRFGN